MSPTPLSLALFWVAVVCYLVALLSFIAGHAFRRRLIGDIGLAAALLGWPFHLASIVTRALEAGHWPLGNMYEYSTAIAFIVVTVFLVLAIRARVRLVGIPAIVL